MKLSDKSTLTNADTDNFSVLKNQLNIQHQYLAIEKIEFMTHDVATY